MEMEDHASESSTQPPPSITLITRWMSNERHCIANGTALAVVNVNGGGVSYVAGMTNANGEGKLLLPTTSTINAVAVATGTAEELH